MNTSITQKALTGLAAFAVTTTGISLPGSNAKAAPLIFDCYSRSTSDLLVKSAIDISNANLACVQGMAAVIGPQAVVAQPVYAAPAAAAPSAGEVFFGSVIGGALGGVLGNAINGGNP